MQSSFSIVIPVYNEEKNIDTLLNEINQIFIDHTKLEIIVVNDFSNDQTLKILNNYSSNIKLKIINNSKNFGQSYSIRQGVKKSKYNLIATLDGDGQNDPLDLIKLIKIYNLNNLKFISGIRTKRKDTYIKIYSSKIANSVRNYFLNDDCKDTGCGIKLFDKFSFLTLPYFNGMHRFYPALFKAYGFKCDFVEVNHRKRNYGISKYGTFGRLFKSLFDLIRVIYIIKKKNNA